MVLYGLGTTIGAGIYALIGEVAGAAGMAAPLAFVAAAGLAGLTALSFAELASRHPQSEGQAAYVAQGFGSPALTLGTGLLVVLAGTASAAVLANGFAGYLAAWAPGSTSLLVLGFTAALGALAAWGVRQSVGVAGLITLVEIAGLVAVAWVARDAFGSLPARWPELAPGADAAAWAGVAGGSLLAFYAFMGFEDMVNVAEEIVHPRITLPRAVVITLAVTVLLYGVIAVVAVLAVPPAELAASEAPVAHLWAASGAGPGRAIRVVAVVSMLNGALIQVIMASRVLYGLARRGRLPGVLARVHPRTRTPLLATALATALMGAFAVALPLVDLARIASGVTLVIFAVVNVALVRIQRRGPAPAGVFSVPGWVPRLGATVSAGLVLWELAAG